MKVLDLVIQYRAFTLDLKKVERSDKDKDSITIVFFDRQNQKAGFNLQKEM
jgi:hypothetical protein